MSALTPHAAPFARRRCLVTGASGFIGAALSRTLADRGACVFALSRTPGRLAPLIAQGRVRHLPCDLTDPASVRASLHVAAPEIVFHFASAPDGPETASLRSERLAVNAMGTLHALQALVDLDLRPIFVYGDSRKVHGGAEPPHTADSPLAPTGVYGASKAAGWLLCCAYASVHQLPVVSLRPSLIYGPGQGRNLIRVALEAARAGTPVLTLQGGAQTRDPIYLDDAIEAFLLAAAKAHELDGAAIPIGGGEEVSVRDLAQRVIDIAQGATVIRCEPAATRPNEIWRSYSDNTDALRLLGWKPRHSLDEGLALTVLHSLQTTPSSSTTHAGAAR
ncbi:MAG: SDR family NAD(P)-dependent oxidoreductase [Planctomycetota bacterium]|nr:MAG: SDR family NAD(P)-dependent oxidoreductase [Planctomycetota bacterium]